MIFDLLEFRILCSHYLLVIFDLCIEFLNLACKFRVVVIEHELSITNQTDPPTLDPYCGLLPIGFWGDGHLDWRKRLGGASSVQVQGSHVRPEICLEDPLLMHTYRACQFSTEFTIYINLIKRNTIRGLHPSCLSPWNNTCMQLVIHQCFPLA